jgi:hypothetical protein
MNLADVMDDLATRLRSIGGGLRVREYPPDTATPDIAVVTYPDAYDYDATMDRGNDRMTVPVVVMVGRVSDRATRTRIAKYCGGSGPESIKAVLEGDGIRTFLDLPAGGTVGRISTPSRAGMPDAAGWGSAPFWVAFDVAPDDWTPATIKSFGASWLSLFAARTWLVHLNTDGAPLVHLFTAAQRDFDFTVPYGFTDGTRHACGFHIQPNDGAGNRRVTAYTAATMLGPWTELQSVAQAGAESLAASNQGAWVGAGDGASTTPFDGDVFDFELRAGDMNGPILSHAPIDATAPGAPAFLDDVSGYAWTLVGDAVLTAGAGPAAYTAFDSCRVMSCEFDTMTVGQVDHLVATFAVDVIGTGD